MPAAITDEILCESMIVAAECFGNLLHPSVISLYRSKLVNLFDRDTDQFVLEHFLSRIRLWLRRLTYAPISLVIQNLYPGSHRPAHFNVMRSTGHSVDAKSARVTDANAAIEAC